MHSVPFVQRYRRTDQDRAGQWAPVGARWKSTASSGLVGHDVYHHLPSDVGTFAQEVASLGAEWYISVQSLDGEFSRIGQRKLQSFQRNAQDTVLNALDANEKDAFRLPERHTTLLLSAPEMEVFERTAAETLVTLQESIDPRATVGAEFATIFVQNLLWGYEQARNRFPDQKRVQAGCQNLSYDLEALELSDVPYGHEIAITLDGYECRIEYEDADAEFMASHAPLKVVWMPWCARTSGYPVRELSVHLDAGSYVQFEEAYFAQLPEESAESPEALLPETEWTGLRNAYVVSPELKAQLMAGESLKLSVEDFNRAEQSPRGFPVL